MEWDDLLRLARAYSYTGPDTPMEPDDTLLMAVAIQRAMRSVGTPEPRAGMEPWDLIQAALRGDVVLPDPESGRVPQRGD